MSEFLKKLGLNIMFKRKEARLTQTQLAQRIGVSNATLSSYENGKRRPSINTVAHIASIFNTPIEEIIPEYDNEDVVDESQTTIFDVLEEDDNED